MSSEINESLKKATGREFFSLLEQHMNIKIPNWLINILILNGHDNVLILSKLDDTVINEIEIYMRDDFNMCLVEENKQIEDYLGIYKNSQSNFKFLSGHKLFLDELRRTCLCLCESVHSAKSSVVGTNKGSNISSK